MIEIVPTSSLHVGPLVRQLADAAKFAAQGGRPRAVLRQSIRESVECWTALKDGVPIAMVGVRAAPLATEGEIWFCVTDAARRHRHWLVRETMAFLAHCFDTLHVLTGVVVCSDERAVRFAQFLGFEVAEAEPFGDGMIRRIRMVR